MKRILLITNRYPRDADDPASPFVPHFVAALMRCGVNVDVLTPRYTQHPPCNEPSFIHRFETGASRPVGSWNFLSPASWIRLAQFLKSGHDLGQELCSATRYDHILALWALPSGEFARRLSNEFGIPYSVWCLGSDIYAWAKRPVFKQLTARVLQNASCVYCDGDDLCARVNSWLSIDCQFLPSFRPLDCDFEPCEPAPTLTPQFLYLGRIHRAKGIFDLVEAFGHVRETLPGATLRIIGIGPDLDQMHQCANREGRNDSVVFTGAISNDQVVAAYRDCDFVVIPTKSDSLPLVFSEAVQACRPVIGTDVGDLGSFIRRYEVGTVVSAAEPDQLATAMREMAARPTFSMEGRARLLKLLDPNRAARAFCERVFGAGVVPHDPSAQTCDTVDPTHPVAMSQ